MVRVGAVFLFLFLVVATSAQAEKRVALVIGNGAYAKVGKLPNPTRDADAMEALFRKAGFDVVEAKRDLGFAAMRRALRDFSDHVHGADIAVVFYAGHGIEVNGTNYLIPVDAALERDIDVEDETVSLDRVTQMLEQAKRLRLIVLDACRDNPFIRSMRRTVSSRSIGRGLAEVRVLSADTLIAFAAKAGSTAADGEGTNSPYTTALAKHVVTPGLDLRLALGRVRDEVLQRTANKQEPHYYGSLGGAEIALVAAKPLAASPEARVSQLSEAAEAWDRTKDTTNIAVLEDFIARYKETFYARLARARIDELKKQQVAIAAPPKVAASPTVPRCDGVDALVGNKRRCLKPKDSFKDCPECPEMVMIPAGEFMMGSPADEAGRSSDESPQHKVTIAKPFAAGRFEATFADWEACAAAGGCQREPSDEGWGKGARPVINVSWEDITKDYLPWLTRKAGKTYRLLTEAEWEYATRAGTTTAYSTGRTITTDQANFDDSSAYGGSGKGVYRQKSIVVGSLNKPNYFGLHDMHGNVSEWVEDCYQNNYVGAPTDGSVKIASCSSRVLRGGSWSNSLPRLRSAFREGYTPIYRSKYQGFRVARTLD
jgi:formylglycine-generating enzyme required for sulfatase activity